MEHEAPNARISPNLRGVHPPIFYSVDVRDWKGKKIDDGKRQGKTRGVMKMLKSDPHANRRQRVLRDLLWRLAKFSSKQEKVAPEDIVNKWISQKLNRFEGNFNSRRLRIFANRVETLFLCRLTEQEAKESWIIVAKRLMDEMNERE